MEDVHQTKKAWVISVNMGYGHERAGFGLADIAYGGVITANDYKGIPSNERALWNSMRKGYESVSRIQSWPLIGQSIFNMMDRFQRIHDFYPRRDESRPNFQLFEFYYFIRHRGLGRDLIERLSKKCLPLIATFFTAAFAAEEHGYPGDIYCVVCDADMSRTWVPLDPKKSRINYFAPTGRVVERLKSYGVRDERIFYTGFPLPKQNVGGPEGAIVKKDLSRRLCQLDPQRIFINKYRTTLETELGTGFDSTIKKRPVSLTFCVGGAGAQRDLGIEIMKSLRTTLLSEQLQLNMIAGTRKQVADRFLAAAKKLGLSRSLNKTLFIHSSATRADYFKSFSRLLRTTDILWTKPSELSFYTGLGLPIIIAPTIGSQEDFNKMWLMTVNGGFPQGDPRYTNEWLFDWINSGGFARFAWNGYIEAPTHGAYRIESIITGKPVPLPSLPLII